MRKYKLFYIFISLFLLNACQAENGINIDNNITKSRNNVNVIIYDGQKKVKLHSDVNGQFLLNRDLLSTTIGQKYLLVIFKNGFLPLYKLKVYPEKNDIPLRVPKLKKFSEDNKSMAYISGMIVRATIGGKINFYSGITTSGHKYKIHIVELDDNNLTKRDFYINSNSNGYFGTYVTPGKYKIEYGQNEVFQLQSGNNGIFLTSMITTID